MEMVEKNYLKQNGISLIELLITMVVVSILTMLAIPSFKEPVNQNNLLAVRDALVRDLTNARNSASRMGVPIQVTMNKVVPSCGSTKMAWAIIRVSNNESIRCQPLSSKLFNKTTMTLSIIPAQWTYLPNGLANSKQNLKVMFSREGISKEVTIFAGGFVRYEN